MLKMRRKIGEKLIIDDEIIIEILEIFTWGTSLQVRLGITAPEEVSVYREEIYQKILETPLVFKN